MNVKIVILDEVELSGRHLGRLGALGEVTRCFDGPHDAEEVVARSADADIVVLGWTTLDGEVFRHLPRLRMISVCATGYDYVDVDAAARHGVTVANVPAHAGLGAAERTISLLFALAHGVESTGDGEYPWRGLDGGDLAGQTLGLVGMGDVGTEIARIATTFGMRVLACAPAIPAGHTNRQVGGQTNRQMGGPNDGRMAGQMDRQAGGWEDGEAGELGVEFRPLDALLAESDVVSLHVPLSTATKGLVGGRELGLMRAGAYLVNGAASGLIDQPALADALWSGRLAGAALDDIDFPDDRLTTAPGILLTSRKADTCVDNVAAFLRGEPANVVTHRRSDEG